MFLCESKKEKFNLRIMIKKGKLNLLGRRALLVDRPLVGPRVETELREYRTQTSVERHIAANAYQIPALLGIFADEDIRPGNSNSGCMISLMAHFRLHHHYKELQKSKQIFQHRAHNFPRH